MELPIGTIWMYYEPSTFRELNIKMSSLKEWGNDFLYDSLIGAVKYKSSKEFSYNCDEMELGKSKETDFEFTTREGLFDENQLFAIYEKKDIEEFIKRLQKTLK